MYMLKGLVRCSACGGTLAVASAKSGKAKMPTVQCCNYNRGSCRTSHSIVVPKLEKAFVQGLKQAVGAKAFTISPERRKQEADKEAPDYAKLIAIEERRLERARSAYLAEIDTIEQYAANKKEITERITELEKERDSKAQSEPINSDAYAKRVAEVVQFIEREDVTAEAKNEALRTVIDKVVYSKPSQNLAIYFYQ